MIKWVLIVFLINLLPKVLQAWKTYRSRSSQAPGDLCVVIDYAEAKQRIMSKRAAYGRL